MKHEKKSNKPVEEMSSFREQIDSLDSEVVRLLNKRMALAQEIGEVKKAKGLPVVDFAREREVLNNLAKENPGPVPNETLRYVYTEVMAAARRIQTPVRVSYLGPEATFTHVAAMSHFGQATTFVPQTSIADVFEDVEKHQSNYGVVPVENSIEGAVNHTLDLFFGSDLGICAEIFSPISHDLLSCHTSAEDVRVVYSHPQAFAQCRGWLRRHLPHADLVHVGSTAEAAKTAAKIKGAAAIASGMAGQLYDLLVLAPHIQDMSHNVTRFLVVGREPSLPSGNDKSSFLFATPHVPGALYKVMAPIAEAGVNMLKLESRPAKNAPWHYLFFVDLEGHMDDENIKAVFDKMQKVCAFIKWMGSYPNAS